MTIFDDAKKMVNSTSENIKKKKRAERQKKKIKKAKKTHDGKTLTTMKRKKKKTDKQRQRSQGRAIRGGMATGKRVALAGSQMAQGNPVAGVVEFI